MGAAYKPREDPSPWHQTYQTLDLGFPAPRTVRNKLLLFKPPNLWYFLMAAVTDDREHLIYSEDFLVSFQNVLSALLPKSFISAIKIIINIPIMKFQRWGEIAVVSAIYPGMVE